MPNLSSQVKKTINKVLSAKGIGGASLASTATLHLAEKGGYSPTTGTVSAGGYYDLTLGTYTASDPPTPLVIPKPIIKRKTLTNEVTGFNIGSQTGTTFYLEPLTNVDAKKLIGCKLTFQGSDYTVVEVVEQYLGTTRMIWEALCQ